MTSLNYGIIGCGNVVERKSGPSIQLAPRSRIVGAMRRDGQKAQAYAETNDVAVWSDDAQDIIEHPDVNIVYVATPPSSHMEYIIAAARAGKHVLCEKPMALNAAQCDRMIAACDDAGVQLFVAYFRRFWPNLLAMKQLIDDGRIGTPMHGHIEIAKPIKYGKFLWHETPEISGGGHFVDVGSHRLDGMVYLLGDVAEARGVVTVFDESVRVEQAVTMAVKFISGVQLSVTGDYYSGKKMDVFRIVGAKGVIEAEHFDGHSFTLKTWEGESEEFSFDEPAAPHVGLIAHIESALLDGAANESSGRDGRITDFILDEALRKPLGIL